MSRLWPPSARGADRWVWAIQGLLLALVGAFSLSTVPGVRSAAGFDPGFAPVLDGWLQGAAYVLCAVVASLRPATNRLDRRLWTLVAAAVALRALAFVLFLGFARRQDPVPYPSVADVGWLAAGVLLVVALAYLIRASAPRLSVSTLLDAVLGALTVAGLASVPMYDALLDLPGDGTPAGAVATNLAYPLLDVVLLILVTGLMVVVGWRPTCTELVLAVAVVGFAVVDAVFLFEVSAGTFRPGSYLSALSLVATAGIALAGWVSPDQAVSRAAQPRPPGIVVPASLALVCVATFLYSSIERAPLISIVLTAAGLVVAIVRVVLTSLGDRGDAQAALRAKHQELLRYQALVEASGDFIAIADIEGRISYVNPAGCRMVGLDPYTEIAGTTIADYLTDEGLRAWSEEQQPAVLANGLWEGQSTLRNRTGGPPIPVVRSVFMIYHPETGEPIAIATVQRDISDQVDAERALRRLADQRQTLLSRLVQAQEDERARIAEDVHDDSVQALAAVELRLGLLRRALAPTAPELAQTVDTMHETVTGATARLRNLLFDLESPAMKTDLATALGEAAAFVFEDTDVRWEITGDCEVDLPEAARVTAYRIAKEAMVNTRKHGQAGHLTINLAREEDGIEVTVADDGRGFDEAAGHDRRGHLGLASMRDRAEIAGGELRVESSPGVGTTVRLRLPQPSPGVEDQRKPES
jgi:PAS domain S-box-containing protein